MATRVLKLAEARAPNSPHETKLIAAWSTDELTECTRSSSSIQESKEIECEVQRVNVPVLNYYARLAELGREGWQIKTLYDSEVIYTQSEIGDIETLLKGQQLP